ncbi:hypothetical protein GCM10027268_16050 [Brachybacterium huguangmaarense]
MRGVDATVNDATAAPDCVKRSSGSAVRLPTTVMMVSPAMGFSSGVSFGALRWLRQGVRAGQGPTVVAGLHGRRAGRAGRAVAAGEPGGVGVTWRRSA